jgi:hypothetical protein
LDPVCPGEQWFFYWKTSAALWEGRIMQIPPREIIFIPLNWGFHAETAQSWDFGKYHPERDLARLTRLLRQHNRKFCWLLPLTPAPFLPNGGLPVFAARTLSIGPSGDHLACLDQEDKLNKMYSFFEPKVFKAYCSFLQELGSFLAEQKVEAPIWGARFNFGAENESFFYDRSLAFEQGFSRYLKQNSPDGTDLTDPREEARLKQVFTEEVQNLFLSVARENLSPFWRGEQLITVLGGSPTETIERSLEDGISQTKLFAALADHQVLDRWVTSSLLGSREKTELLRSYLADNFGPEEIERRYHHQWGRSPETEWRSCGQIDLFDFDGQGQFQTSGLLSFLELNFPWMYRVFAEMEFNAEWIEQHQENVKFFQGRGLSRVRFGQMLKLFMMGQKIVLDTHGLAPELEKRLQIFYLENNLQLQMVKFQTQVSLCELGEGKFITYDGAPLSGTDNAIFWQQIIKYLHLPRQQVSAELGVFGQWKIRAANSHELSYLDVRRLSLYNPTSYKRQVKVSGENSFAFMRMVDPVKASAKSSPHAVEIELLPQGRIALDFGRYGES